jgi:hypothetical protein
MRNLLDYVGSYYLFEFPFWLLKLLPAMEEVIWNRSFEVVKIFLQ